jgi:oxygen-dependent protoporphyrinogen oxidase
LLTSVFDSSQLHELKLEDQILYTAKSSPASQNRYIYYPDHLIQLPSFDRNAGTLSNIWRLLNLSLREPIIRHAGLRVLAEPFQDATQPATDESVASFISRRLSPEVADVLVSSVYHGIYAGNIDQLSASALMGTMRDYERHDGNALLQMATISRAGLSVVHADEVLALAPLLANKGRQYTKELSALVKDNSTLTLQKGVGRLTEALLAELKRSDKVEVLTGAEVKGIYQNSTSSNLGVCLILRTERSSQILTLLPGSIWR